MSEKVQKSKYLVEEEFEEEEVEEITLTNLLINSGIENYELRLNLLSNEIYTEIPDIGKTFKRLRFEKKINFSIINGAHAYFIDDKKKMTSLKKSIIKFDWKSYDIPDGSDELYVVFKIPGSEISPHHFLMSCFPSAIISGFKIFIDSKFEKSFSFRIHKERLDGYFDNDKLILKCRSSSKDIDKTVYTIVQIGRNILTELIKLNFRYSEILQIFFPIKSDFFPVVPIFRSKKQGVFFNTKYSNILRIFYDFPKEFKGKLIYGKHSLIINGDKDDNFELKTYYDFISDAFEFQTKSFVSLSILNDWVINPTKTLNYMEEDDDLRNLLEEYRQDIDTDRIIQERLEETLEKGEFFKEITSNLLLTLLGVSLLADWPPLQWVVLVILILINVYYFIKRRKKFKKRTQIL